MKKDKKLKGITFSSVLTESKFIPVPRQGHKMIKKNENEFILYGGRLSSYRVASDISTYNINSKKFQSHKYFQGENFEEIPPRSGHSIIFNKITQKLYVFFGRNNGYDERNYLMDIWTYSFVSKKAFRIFKEKTLTEKDLILPRLNSHGTCFDQKNNIAYVVCGRNKSGELNHVYQFNLFTFQFERIDEEKQNKMEPRKGVSVHLFDDKLVIFGGQAGTYEKNIQGFNDVHIFDLKKRKMKKLKTFGKCPFKRNGCCSIIYNSKLFIVGGLLDDLFTLTEKDYSRIFYLDLICLKWFQIGTNKNFKFCFADSVLFGKRWIFFGGSREFSVTNKVMELHFEEDIQNQLPSSIFVNKLLNNKQFVDFSILVQRK